MGKIGGRRADRLIVLSLAVASFILYCRTLAPGVLDGDSGEWQYMANILGVAHSTGYPLYLLLAKVVTLLPLGSPAWRVNLFSAISAALAVGVVYLLAKRLTISRFAAACAAALFAVAPTLWASAVEAEVYALNTLLVALVLLFAVRWHQERSVRDLYLAAFAFGLALDNHRVSAFLAPGLFLLVLLDRKSLTWRQVAGAAVAIAAPLLLYAYIPIRASMLLAEQSAANWELYPRAEAFLKGTVSAYYNHSLYGFLNLVTGFDNRNKLGFAAASGGDSLLDRAGSAALLLLQQFNPLVILVALAGLWIFWRRDHRLALALLVAGASVSAISLTLRAESTRFYFSPAYLVLTLGFAIGAAELAARLQMRRPEFALAIGIFVALPLLGLIMNFRSMDRSGDNSYDAWAHSVLSDKLAPQALVVAPWEIVTSLRYYQMVEGQRPDILFVHESPIRPQYDKLLASAHALKRPFYYVLFTPEDQRSPGPRSVQAVGLPLLERPAPETVLDEKLNESVRVIGYDLNPDPSRPKDFARLSIYYQVVGPLNAQYKAGLDWSEIRQEPHANWEQMPVTAYYPTYFWKTGDYFRDVWTIPLAENPSGLYTAQLSWYPFDPTTNTTNYDAGLSVTLGPLRLGNFDAGQIPRPQQTAFADAITLLGFGLQGQAPGTDVVNVARGGKLRLALYWVAGSEVPESLTTFVHLQSSDGLVRSQLDKEPWNGLYPTDLWTSGETVRDDFELDLPSDLPPGPYTLRVGLYHDPNKRIPLLNGGDEVQLDVHLNLK